MQPQTQQQPQMHQQPQMQQKFVSQNPGVTVVTQNQPEMDRNKLQPSALSQIKWLSITQIVMGGLCIIFGGILIGLEFVDYFLAATGGYSLFGYGIWSGLYYVLAGGIGLGAVRYNTRCWIVSAMILNIICSSMFFLPLLILSAVAMSVTSIDCTYSQYGCGYSSVEQASLAFNSLLLLISIAELVITIWSAVLCCGAVCGCCYTSPHTHVVQYHTAPGVQTQQQFAMYPSVPATTTYGVGMPGYQISAYPTAIHQQPSGGYMVQPQGPPSYYTANQNAQPQNSGYEHVPHPTAYPNDPQHPNKQQQ